MAGQIVQLVVVLVLIGLFVWLVSRAWGSRRGLLKWPGTILAGLVTLLLTVVLVVAGIGFFKLHQSHDNPVQNFTVAANPDQLALGQRYANACTGCHSSTDGLPLGGGDENFASPFGTLYPPNLTPAGPLKDWSDGEILRALREGVHKDGRSLIVMPSQHYHYMSDSDAQAIIAYLRSQPPVQHDTPNTNLNLLGMLLIGAGLFPTSAQPAITQPVIAPPAGVTPQYGEYLVNIGGCSECHGKNLTGGSGGFTPAGPNLRGVAQAWNESDFVRTIQTGTDPSGRALDPDEMPWKEISAAYTADQLKAVYAYLRSLPAQ